MRLCCHINMNHVSSICRTPARFGPQWTAPLTRVFLCCLLLIDSGCNVSSPRYQPDARVVSTEEISLNSEQLRRQVRAQVQPLSGIIVACDPFARNRRSWWMSRQDIGTFPMV
jgi:hypothetical protein